MIGRVLGRIVLTVLYFLVVTPLALIRRGLWGDPLRHAVGDLGYWLRHTPGGGDMRSRA